MQGSPTIVGHRLPTMPWEKGGNVVALLTVEYGPCILRGVALRRQPSGELYIGGAFMRNRDDRLVIRSGPERDAILAAARHLFPHTAAPPLATAPELEPSE